MLKKVYILIFLAAAIGIAARNRVSDEDDFARRKKFDYFFLEGLNLKTAGKYDASFEMFRHCLTIDSTSSAALYELSSYYIQLNQNDKAIELLKKCIAYSPDNEEYHGILATLLFNNDMFGEAADEYELLVKMSPSKLELKYFLAESYSRMGEISKAIEIYNVMENEMGINEAISMEKYRLYMTLEKKEEAFNELVRLVEKYPSEPRYQIILGDLYLQQNDTEKALKYYTKAHETDPQSPYYPVSMANYYDRTGQSDSAKKQINEALINERLDVNTKLNILARYIIMLQRSKQDFESANTLFTTLIEQHPDELRLKLAFGEFLASQKKFDEARFQYQLVTEIEPENIDAWQQLLKVAVQQEDMDEILRISQKCKLLFPEEFIFQFYVGIMYAQKGEYQAALETMDTLLVHIPSDNKLLMSDIYGQRGDIYFRLKDIDNAFDAYEKALKYNDKNIGVLNNYAYYLSLLKKDLTKAERMSALSIKMEPDNPTYIDTYAWIFFVQGNYALAKIYMEQAVSKSKSAELYDHYGDILYMSGEKEKAVEQWVKAKEAGKKSPTLEKKIDEQKYYEETEDELFNNVNESSNEN